MRTCLHYWPLFPNNSHHKKCNNEPTNTPRNSSPVVLRQWSQMHFQNSARAYYFIFIYLFFQARRQRSVFTVRLRFLLFTVAGEITKFNNYTFSAI